MEIGSIIITDIRATEYEAHSRPLGWNSFQNFMNKTQNVTELYVNFRNVECSTTYTATLHKNRKLVLEETERQLLNNDQ
jgi:hypothetical protein